MTTNINDNTINTTLFNCQYTPSILATPKNISKRLNFADSTIKRNMNKTTTQKLLEKWNNLNSAKSISTPFKIRNINENYIKSNNCKLLNFDEAKNEDENELLNDQNFSNISFGKTNIFQNNINQLNNTNINNEIKEPNYSHFSDSLDIIINNQFFNQIKNIYLNTKYRYNINQDLRVNEYKEISKKRRKRRRRKRKIINIKVSKKRPSVPLYKICCHCPKCRCNNIVCPCFKKNKKCGINCGCYKCLNADVNKEKIRYNRTKSKINCHQYNNTMINNYNIYNYHNSQLIQSFNLNNIACACRKSKCNKNFCDCFKFGKKCIKGICKCVDCCNK